MDFNEKIIKHLKKYNYDIRIHKDARFMDQKVTPDVLSIISDCVIQFIKDDPNQEFTTKDIWKSDYSNENVKNIFNKPDVSNISAKSEYDKFFQQPLKMLCYSKILLCEKRGNKNYFTVNNLDLLKYISFKERNALTFLNLYLEKVLKDSGIWELFEEFFEQNTKSEFNELKEEYEKFIIKNTAINGTTEVRRIFTKIINPLCYIRKLHGTKRGFYSKFVIDYDELMYNRRNWRDILKKRNETRQEYMLRAKREIKRSRDAYVQYIIQKVREYHKGISEVKDEWAIGEATQAHHIFPQSEFRDIADYAENIIILTPTQHLTKAHPHNNTRKINKDYQLICLISKSESIKKSIKLNDGMYSKEDFIYVINEGLNLRLSTSIKFKQIITEINKVYNSS